LTRLNELIIRVVHGHFIQEKYDGQENNRGTGHSCYKGYDFTFIKVQLFILAIIFM